MNDDMELVRDYAARQSEPAFAALVSRHVGLVHSAALRQVCDPHLAEEIAQTVFIILARKAGSLSPQTILPGWLYRTTRYVASAALKLQRRREHREQEALMSNVIQEAQSDPAWEQFAPLLDDAMAQLRDKDRDAIVLRYFQNRSLRDVGDALGVNELAAQKRVGRAVEKLRRIFGKRGVNSTASAITDAISHHSVQPASELLVKTITAAALAKGATASAGIIALMKGTMKMMTWMKLKLAIGAGAVVLLAGSTAMVAFSDGEHADTPSTAEIFKNARDTYASLTSYSDEGQSVSTLNGTTITTTFTIKLARPSLYRIEWQQKDASSFGITTTKREAVWSAGDGDFLDMGHGAEKERNREMALSGATGISGGAAATIPGTFFRMNWGNELGGSTAKEKRQPDENVGGVDCYVFTEELKKGVTRTLWIGKQDFLIHQIRNVMSAEAMKAVLADALKRSPQIAGRIKMTEPTENISIQTHSNIVLNAKLSPSDFAR